MTQPVMRAVRGFTLIEVMIVVAVVAILAAVAYPSYQDSVRKSRRAQAKADMLEIAQRYERFHTINNRYTGFWALNYPSATSVPSPATGGTPAYLIEAGEAANTFTLTATPQGAQVKDTLCGTLTVNQVGARTENGSGQLANCW